MKKYKCIKKYPGSPDVGTILGLTDKSSFYGWIKQVGNPYYAPIINSTTVENNPEYYEEVKELEYKILSFIVDDDDIAEYDKSCSKSYPYNSKKNGKFSLDYALKHYKINSIQRLSDSQVFQLEDKVEWNWSPESDCTYLTIKMFAVQDGDNAGKILVGCQLPDSTLVTPYVDLLHDEDYNFRLHTPKVLFTTEDGVYIINPKTSTYFIHPNITTTLAGAYSKWTGTATVGKYFYFEHAAQAYLDELAEKELRDKKCLSYNELEDILCAYSLDFVDIMYDIKQLIKSKQ